MRNIYAIYIYTNTVQILLYIKVHTVYHVCVSTFELQGQLKKNNFLELHIKTLKLVK
jgi:hypothetical protein